MYTFLKALDEKRSNLRWPSSQTLVWKKSSRRATSAHWGNFWVALLRGTIPVQIKVWWSDHPWRLLYSSRAFRRYIILGVTPLNSKFQKFDNVRGLGGVTQQVAHEAEHGEHLGLPVVLRILLRVIGCRRGGRKHWERRREEPSGAEYVTDLWYGEGMVWYGVVWCGYGVGMVWVWCGMVW
jgi:hypothetical protein